MPDSCVAEDPGASNAMLSIILSGVGVVLASMALVIDPFRPSYARSLSFAAILLGVPTIALFFATGGTSATELSCCVALTNSVGPLPAALLAAVASIVVIVADRTGVLARCGGGGATSVPSPVTRALFPPGMAWRARDAAVVATTAITVVFSGCVLGLYDPYLRTPEDASWDVTIGALLVSSVLCGPLLVYLSADELTSFVSGMEEKDREPCHLRIHPRMLLALTYSFYPSRMRATTL